MTSTPITIDHHDDGNVRCWCCGNVEAANRMVQLGDHPEVNLCVGCAHYVHQQAWQLEDQGKRGPGALTRDGLRNLRAEVMRRGWHRNRFVGGKLRWLGRYLP